MTTSSPLLVSGDSLLLITSDWSDETPTSGLRCTFTSKMGDSQALYVRGSGLEVGGETSYLTQCLHYLVLEKQLPPKTVNFIF